MHMSCRAYQNFFFFLLKEKCVFWVCVNSACSGSEKWFSVELQWQADIPKTENSCSIHDASSPSHSHRWISVKCHFARRNNPIYPRSFWVHDTDGCVKDQQITAPSVLNQRNKTKKQSSSQAFLNILLSTDWRPDWRFAKVEQRVVKGRTEV